ncbi:nucleotidyltransferase family protein [Desulfosarcina ovata]|uniref:Nucleoside-diphosphate-sugar pyrophosphorylase n=1 Tax=Desulfosarcina ovata subsp. ovata TaxID=2752305 RepID=A0A5K8A2Y5_9BACT|nr:nucleotidyltransferase family protein [Desulfosarcina ovata]BBO86923.1 nucleoside-diphosphate-sugar pyrophosphorylase [Desulfosarcina ovata subsp. ovata]
MKPTHDAIILAGGLGTRLRAVVPVLPKPLAPVGGKPFLDILLNQLRTSGFIKNVVIAIGYKGEWIEKQYGKRTNCGFTIMFSKEDKLLGTGGAIKKALALTTSQSVLVLNGDSYIEVNISELIQSYQKNRASLSMVLKEVQHADRYGSVVMDETNRILSFSEKRQDIGASKGLINAGMYLINASVFDAIPKETVLSLEMDILPELVKERLYGFVSTGKFIDIGIPETYQIADTYLEGV